MKLLKTVDRKRFNLLQNPFDIHTRHSYKKMHAVAGYTRSALKTLQAQPFFAELYAELNPVLTAYDNLYVTFGASAGKKQGNTLGLMQLMQELSRRKVRQWEVQVLNVFEHDSAEYKSLFPNKRNPFQSGSYDTRISAVGVLMLELQKHPPLAITLADVTLFHDKIKNARKEQLGSKGARGLNSVKLEPQRVLLADTLYGIMGRLMHHHKQQRDMIEIYFDFHRLFGARRKYVEVAKDSDAS